MAEQFRELFITYNRPWMRENLHDVFTPRTLFKNREIIIDEFGKALGYLEPDVSLEEFNDDYLDQMASSESPLDTEEQEVLEDKNYSDIENLKEVKERIKQDIEQDKINYAAHIKKQSPVSVAIVKYWLMRTRFLNVLRTQLSIVIRNNLEQVCQLCGTEYGLQSELIQSLEDMFFIYLRNTNQTINNFNFGNWVTYFTKNSTFRTLCNDCHDDIMQDYQM
jgi:hypothetical protein